MNTVSSLVLLPQPKSIQPRNGALALGHLRSFSMDARLPETLAERVRTEARQNGRFGPLAGSSSIPSGQARLDVVLDDTVGAKPEAYRLSVSPGGISIRARDERGAFHAVSTLIQMLRQADGELPACEIEDAPDFPVRGVMLDVSRDKVPTLDTLKNLVDLLAEWKINRLELYMEHTFAYRNHAEVWAEADPYTAQDIRTLDAYCRTRNVELVPNQNSFGHLHRWLENPSYRHLAECPDGFTLPSGRRREGPFSLDPTNPGSLKLLAELYDELLPNFTSRNFNVGCDETWDLGQGRSSAVCVQKGKGRVYLDFLLEIHKLVKARGRTMHFWGDIVIKHPELVPEIPKDAVVLEWGYDSDHDFQGRCAKFAASGIPFFVCPGTSSWCSIAGRTDNALANLRNAAEAGLAHGATGYLNTDWGDQGHWQYLPVSYLGFSAGAAFSWNFESNRTLDIARALDLHAFYDSADVMGRLVCGLGNTYLRAGAKMGNGSLFFMALQNKDYAWREGVTKETLQASEKYVDETMSALNRAHMNRPDADLIRTEFDNAARMIRNACRQGIAGKTDRRKELGASLAAEMRTILGEHRRLWVSRNRIGGLQDSTRELELRQKEYRQWTV